MTALNFLRTLCTASVLLAGVAHGATSSFNIGKTEVQQFKLVQPGGPEVEYFISKTAQPAALILLLQGSGCMPVFAGLDTPGKRSSNIFGYIDWALQGKYAVMVVNKPYAPKEHPYNDGTATACPREFNDYFALDSWVRHVRLALAHARQLPWVDTRRALVVGVSEGATTAAALAGLDPQVSDVALLGGSGATQLYDFVLGAYQGPGGDSGASARLDALEVTRKQIYAKPDSGTDFAWGHSFKRWSSFFRASASANLLKSAARVYIASGMQDHNVPILSTEVMASELLAAGRDVSIRRVPNAGHNLMPDGSSYEAMEAEYQRILAWYEQAGK
ncbi:MAG: prolyl oligopeptidase family serine peptidase [Pseudomonadota bacterium]